MPTGLSDVRDFYDILSGLSSRLSTRRSQLTCRKFLSFADRGSVFETSRKKKQRRQVSYQSIPNSSNETQKLLNTLSNTNCDYVRVSLNNGNSVIKPSGKRVRFADEVGHDLETITMIEASEVISDLAGDCTNQCLSTISEDNDESSASMTESEHSAVKQTLITDNQTNNIINKQSDSLSTLCKTSDLGSSSEGENPIEKPENTSGSTPSQNTTSSVTELDMTVNKNLVTGNKVEDDKNTECLSRKAPLTGRKLQRLAEGSALKMRVASPVLSRRRQAGGTLPLQQASETTAANPASKSVVFVHDYERHDSDTDSVYNHVTNIDCDSYTNATYSPPSDFKARQTLLSIEESVDEEELESEVIKDVPGTSVDCSSLPETSCLDLDSNNYLDCKTIDRIPQPNVDNYQINNHNCFIYSELLTTFTKGRFAHFKMSTVPSKHIRTHDVLSIPSKANSLNELTRSLALKQSAEFVSNSSFITTDSKIPCCFETVKITKSFDKPYLTIYTKNKLETCEGPISTMVSKSDVSSNYSSIQTHSCQLNLENIFPQSISSFKNDQTNNLNCNKLGIFHKNKNIHAFSFAGKPGESKVEFSYFNSLPLLDILSTTPNNTNILKFYSQFSLLKNVISSFPLVNTITTGSTLMLHHNSSVQSDPLSSLSVISGFSGITNLQNDRAVKLRRIHCAVTNSSGIISKSEISVGSTYAKTKTASNFVSGCATNTSFANREPHFKRESCALESCRPVDNLNAPTVNTDVSSIYSCRSLCSDGTEQKLKTDPRRKNVLSFSYLQTPTQRALSVLRNGRTLLVSANESFDALTSLSDEKLEKRFIIRNDDPSVLVGQTVEFNPDVSDSNVVRLSSVEFLENCIYCSVCVRIIACPQLVFIRASYDRWESHFDYLAHYRTDRVVRSKITSCFTAKLPVFVRSSAPTSKSRNNAFPISFAVCCKLDNANSEIWDNNLNKNYNILYLL